MKLAPLFFFGAYLLHGPPEAYNAKNIFQHCVYLFGIMLWAVCLAGINHKEEKCTDNSIR